MPLIDILLSTYNGERYIEAQVDSILAQDFHDFRLLIRDDGSSDNTLEIVKRLKTADPRIVLQRDALGSIGPQRSFMSLLDNSENAYFMFSDQDDVWLPDKISRSLEAVSGLSERYGNDIPLAVFTDLTVCDDGLAIIDRSFWHYQSLEPSIALSWRKLLAQNVITACTLIGNAAARRAALPFVLTEMLHDHWVGVNAARKGHIAYLSEATVLYRQHFSNVEGARRFDAAYAAGRLRSPGKLLKAYIAAGRHFGVSPLTLAYHKLMSNLPRFFRR